jgi:hypothetical protein
MRTLLRGVADVEVPPARVDLGQAIAGGRRQRRRAIAAAGSGLALAVAAGAFVATTVTASPQAAVPQARGTVSPSATTPGRVTDMPGSAPERFDPLVPYAAYGWLPAGYTVGSQGAGPDSTTRSVQLTAATASGSRQIQLTVDARGACTGSVHSSMTCAGTNDSVLQIEHFTAAPAVGGRPSYWARDKYVGGYLLWQYAPGAWASLHVGGSLALSGASAQERAMLRQIAEHVRYAAGTPIAFPYWVRLPAGWTVAETGFGPGPAGGLLGYGLQAGPAAKPEAVDLAVQTVAPGNSDSCLGTPNVTLDGTQAMLTEPGQPPVYQSLCADSVEGLNVYVALDLTRPGGQPLLSEGALGLAGSMHLLGGQSSGWTTKPLR